MSAQPSFSQQGEDRILQSLFQGKATGFYIDVGAHDPERYSNTALFYAQGWRGINIDPDPAALRKFRVARADDTNLELAVGLTDGLLVYHCFTDSAVNGCGFSDARVEELSRFGYVGMREVRCVPLARIIETCGEGREIDFLTVDAEGMDEEVLASNDWDCFRPKVVVAEDLKAFTLEEVVASPVSRLLHDVGYDAVAKCHHSIVFARMDLIHDHNFRSDAR